MRTLLLVVFFTASLRAAEKVQDRFPGEDWMQYDDVADAGFSP
jgi:hypothetical protein